MKAAQVIGSDGISGVPHAMRIYALRNIILPHYSADKNISELIVVGEWEPGEGYTYIKCPSVHFSSVDALKQRQVGFEASTGDVVIHSHDDHILAPDWATCLDSRADILIPQRWTRLRHSFGEVLNNGEPTPQDPRGYVSGHCAVYKREVLERCPWSMVPAIRTWDMQATRLYDDAGFKIVRSQTLRCYDTEFGSSPWA